MHLSALCTGPVELFVLRMLNGLEGRHSGASWWLQELTAAAFVNCWFSLVTLFSVASIWQYLLAMLGSCSCYPLSQSNLLDGMLKDKIVEELTAWLWLLQMQGPRTILGTTHFYIFGTVGQPRLMCQMRKASCAAPS